MRAAVRLAGFAFASALVLSTVRVDAAGPGDQQAQQSSTQAPRPSADFLFGRPRASIGVRGGWLFASAGSDIFDFVTRHLTLDKKDFNAPGFGADVAFSITPRIDIVGGFEMNRVERDSEYRDFVDNRLQPIEQTTGLKTTHVGASLRYALVPRGTAISRLAWIPNRVVPYVGGGGGFIHYDFEQTGDFVDFQDLSVFPEAFRASGWTLSAHAYGGVDVQLYRALYGTVQARYTKAAGKLGSDFIDFDPIDLSGVRVSAGINVLF